MHVSWCLISVITMLVEVCQLLALSFRHAVPWHSSASSIRSISLPLLFDVSSHTLFELLTIASFVFALLFLLCLLPFVITNSERVPTGFQWHQEGSWKRLIIAPAPYVTLR